MVPGERKPRAEFADCLLWGLKQSGLTQKAAAGRINAKLRALRLAGRTQLPPSLSDRTLSSWINHRGLPSSVVLIDLVADILTAAMRVKYHNGKSTPEGHSIEDWRVRLISLYKVAVMTSTIAPRSANTFHKSVGESSPAIRRSHSYAQRLVPSPFHGRENEQAEAYRIGGSSAPAGQFPILWWQAGPWTGKTALSAWLTLHPPPLVDVVSFFIVDRLADHADSIGYTKEVGTQFAELAGMQSEWPRVQADDLPILVVQACARANRAGRRIVLIVDALDEDQGSWPNSGLPSIASLLPSFSSEVEKQTLSLILTSRKHPPLPLDVPTNHPIKKVQSTLLTPSPHALVGRREALEEIQYRLTRDTISAQILTYLAAASPTKGTAYPAADVPEQYPSPGVADTQEHDQPKASARGTGLSASDLAELIGVRRPLVAAALRSGYSSSLRTDMVRSGDSADAEIYYFAHETLTAITQEEVGIKEIALARARINAWADSQLQQGWSAETPHYLVSGYSELLYSLKDTRRLYSLVKDTRRLNLMLRRTGAHLESLHQAHLVEQLAVDSQDPDLAVLAGVAIVRWRLEQAERNLPPSLATLWIELGDLAHAEQLIESESASVESSAKYQRVLKAAIESAAACGYFEWAERMTQRIGAPSDRAAAFATLGKYSAISGDRERAIVLAKRATDIPYDRTHITFRPDETIDVCLAIIAHKTRADVRQTSRSGAGRTAYDDGLAWAIAEDGEWRLASQILNTIRRGSPYYVDAVSATGVSAANSGAIFEADEYGCLITADERARIDTAIIHYLSEHGAVSEACARLWRLLGGRTLNTSERQTRLDRYRLEDQVSLYRTVWSVCGIMAVHGALEDALLLARNLPSPSARAAALAEISAGSAKDSALIATAVLDEAVSSLSERRDMRYLEDKLRQEATGIVAASFAAAGEMLRAFDLIQREDLPVRRYDILEDAARALARRKEWVRSVEFACKLPGGTWRSRVLCEIATSILPIDREQARHLAGQAEEAARIYDGETDVLSVLSIESMITGKKELGLSLMQRIAEVEWPPAWLPLEEILRAFNDAGQYEDTKKLWRKSDKTEKYSPELLRAMAMSGEVNAALDIITATKPRWDGDLAKDWRLLHFVEYLLSVGLVEPAAMALGLIDHPALRLLGLSHFPGVMPDLHESLQLVVSQVRPGSIDESSEYLLRELVSGLARSGHIPECEAVAEAAIEDEALRAEALAEAALCTAQQEAASRLAKKAKALKKTLENPSENIEAAIAMVSLRAGSIDAVRKFVSMTGSPYIKKRLLVAIARSPQISEQHLQLWLRASCLELQSKYRYVYSGPVAEFTEFAGPALAEVVSSLCDAGLLDCAGKLAADIQHDRSRVRALGIVAVNMDRIDPRRAKNLLAQCLIDRAFIDALRALRILDADGLVEAGSVLMTLVSDW